LRGAALELSCAVILLAHPSLSGMSSGSGLSGSTAWSNSVRSRLYLSTPKRKKSKDEDEEPPLEAADENAPENAAKQNSDLRDNDTRVLEAKKSNYSELAATKMLVWDKGVFKPIPPETVIDRAAKIALAREIFLKILERYNRQDLTVSRKERSPNFAPAEFAKQPEAKALDSKSNSTRKKLLREAMEYLFSHERIFVGQGPKSARPSRQSECIYAAGSLL